MLSLPVDHAGRQPGSIAPSIVATLRALEGSGSIRQASLRKIFRQQVVALQEAIQNLSQVNRLDGAALNETPRRQENPLADIHDNLRYMVRDIVNPRHTLQAYFHNILYIKHLSQWRMGRDSNPRFVLCLSITRSLR
jgi:hypothetical protein